ncbi:zinc-binding dehydrogenase [Streptomyces sp. NPDC051020]|uniref:zinc-binding dehydrogenase n=1 Tax=Streptomyces sp. NPDC051020 TaxID=3155409 RepID=UPI00341B16D9
MLRPPPGCQLPPLPTATQDQAHHPRGKPRVRNDSHTGEPARRPRGGHADRPHRRGRRPAGADHVVVWSGGGFEDRIKELTGGEGADVVYDGGGTPTFRSSQLSLRAHGVHAYYGPIMGIPTFTPMDLPNSILLSYPVVHDHVRTREALVEHTGEIFDMILAGTLTPRIGRRYALKDAAQAHADIASRTTTGKLLLLP